MVELIAKISKGSKMDQIYIPKNRSGLQVGNYVVIKPLLKEIPKKTLYFYNAENIEPIKINIINQVFLIIENNIEFYDNIIITGSFLEKGFNFNDLDILIISKEKIDADFLKNILEKSIGIKMHLILMNNAELIKGLSIDPLYQMMISKCVSEKRLIYRLKNEINYKLLDLQLLKSKSLIDNFDVLDGKEKYYLTKNMIAIRLFLQNERLNNKKIDETVKEELKTNPDSIKNNLLEKKEFIKKYNVFYKKTFNKILSNIKNGSEQEKIN
ncbi:hypothetical protein HY837_02795 [archaeon]|nr:hypothetical protein [archaeon]